jgi:hypothetical protein
MSYADQERHPLSLDAVVQSPTTSAAGFGHGHIQPEGQIGLKTARSQGFQCSNQA